MQMVRLSPSNGLCVCARRENEKRARSYGCDDVTPTMDFNFIVIIAAIVMQTLSGAKCDDASPHTACCMCVIESGRRRPIFARRHCRNARTLHNGITLSLDIIYICDIKAHSNHKFSEALTVAARTHFFYLSSLLFFLVFVQFLDNNHVTVRRRSPALSPSR